MECHPCFYLLAFPCCFTPSLASCLFSPVSPSRHGSPHLNSFVAPPASDRRSETPGSEACSGNPSASDPKTPPPASDGPLRMRQRPLCPTCKRSEERADIVAFAARELMQATYGLQLDLTHPFTSQPYAFAHLLQCARRLSIQPKAQRQDITLPGTQVSQPPMQGRVQSCTMDMVGRIDVGRGG